MPEGEVEERRRRRGRRGIEYRTRGQTPLVRARRERHLCGISGSRVNKQQKQARDMREPVYTVIPAKLNKKLLQPFSSDHSCPSSESYSSRSYT